jgi:hypothetical protein
MKVYYWHRTGRMSNCLNKLLCEILGCTPAVILTIFFFKVKKYSIFYNRMMVGIVN